MSKGTVLETISIPSDPNMSLFHRGSSSQHQAIVKATHATWALQIQGLSTATGMSPLSLGQRARGSAGLMEKGLPWLGVEPSQSRGAALAEGKAGGLPGTSAKRWYPSAVAPWGLTTGTVACALLLAAEDYLQEGSYLKGKFSSWKNVPGHLCMARASHEMAAALYCRAGVWRCPAFPTPAPPCPVHLIDEVSWPDEHQNPSSILWVEGEVTAEEG